MQKDMDFYNNICRNSFGQYCAVCYILLNMLKNLIWSFHAFEKLREMAHFRDVIETKGMVNVIKLMYFYNYKFRFYVFIKISIWNDFLIFFWKNWGGGGWWTLSNMVLFKSNRNKNSRLLFFQVGHHQQNPNIIYVAWNIII